MFTMLKKTNESKDGNYLTPRLRWHMTWQWNSLIIKCQCLIILKPKRNEHLKKITMLPTTSKSNWLSQCKITPPSLSRFPCPLFPLPMNSILQALNILVLLQTFWNIVFLSFGCKGAWCSTGTLLLLNKSKLQIMPYMQFARLWSTRFVLQWKMNFNVHLIKIGMWTYEGE
jgi:hypothetical protein